MSIFLDRLSKVFFSSTVYQLLITSTKMAFRLETKHFIPLRSVILAAHLPSDVKTNRLQASKNSLTIRRANSQGNIERHRLMT